MDPIPGSYRGSIGRPEVELLMGICEILVDAMRDHIRAANEERRQRLRPSRGATVRPGAETPLWNAVVGEARVLTRKRGAKVNLGRHLGVPRQRIHEYLKSGSAAPDAERALQLLLWIGRKRQTRKVASQPEPLSRNT